MTFTAAIDAVPDLMPWLLLASLVPLILIRGFDVGRLDAHLLGVAAIGAVVLVRLLLVRRDDAR